MFSEKQNIFLCVTESKTVNIRKYTGVFFARVIVDIASPLPNHLIKPYYVILNKRACRPFTAVPWRHMHKGEKQGLQMIRSNRLIFDRKEALKELKLLGFSKLNKFCPRYYIWHVARLSCLSAFLKLNTLLFYISICLTVCRCPYTAHNVVYLMLLFSSDCTKCGWSWCSLV